MLEIGLLQEIKNTPTLLSRLTTGSSFICRIATSNGVQRIKIHIDMPPSHSESLLGAYDVNEARTRQAPV